ncbi:MAG: NADH-quinone oxidoreductase subunit NuoI [candidate division Zixibacteria bacterium]|nr:NADH-quinone oxidoreductase subunit NuoI [candidate division Zixibacteria bacterium]
MKEIVKALGHVVLKMPIGFYVTLKHLFRKPVTLDYPRQKKPMVPRYRGKHYLERYIDGTERCVCCGLCAAACPADAIYMEPEENEKGERRAKVYEINLLRCIFCGFCEEACPEEAIFLGQEYEFSDYMRDSFINTKDKMLVPHPRKDSPLKRIYRRVRRVYGVTDKVK